MNLKIKTKNKDALITLGRQLKNTGFHVVYVADNELTIPNIGRKSFNY